MGFTISRGVGCAGLQILLEQASLEWGVLGITKGGENDISKPLRQPSWFLIPFSLVVGSIICVYGIESAIAGTLLRKSITLVKNRGFPK